MFKLHKLSLLLEFFLVYLITDSKSVILFKFITIKVIACEWIIHHIIIKILKSDSKLSVLINLCLINLLLLLIWEYHFNLLIGVNFLLMTRCVLIRLKSNDLTQSHSLKDYLKRSTLFCVKGLSKFWDNVKHYKGILIITLLHRENNAIITESWLWSDAWEVRSNILLNPII